MSHAPSSQPQDQTLFIALLVLIVWIPLPHGGELLWEHSSFGFASLLLLALWIIQHRKSRAPLPPIVYSLKRPLLLLLCWLAYVFMQAMPIPQVLLRWLNPAALPHTEAIQRIGGNAHFSLSIDPGSTSIEGLKYSSYVAVFFLALVLCNSRKRIKTIAVTVFLTGAGLSLYSLINHYTNGSMSVNNPIPPWGNPWAKSTRGTFSHQNHFAGFMAMTIPLGLGLLYAQSCSDTHRYKKTTRLAVTVEFLLSINALYVALLACMVTSLLLTTSRGGNGAFLVAILISTVLFSIKKHSSISLKKTAISSVILLIAIIALASANLATGLSKRLLEQGLTPNGRDLMRTTAFKVIKENPLLGRGAGTYPYLQHVYKTGELGVSSMSKRAHNDYLELLCEQGIVGFVMLATALFSFLYCIYSTLGAAREHALSTGLLWGACTGLCSILIHTLVEFNFQIPANAVYFLLLLTIGLAVNYSTALLLAAS